MVNQSDNAIFRCHPGKGNMPPNRQIPALFLIQLEDHFSIRPGLATGNDRRLQRAMPGGCEFTVYCQHIGCWLLEGCAPR